MPVGMAGSGSPGVPDILGTSLVQMKEVLTGSAVPGAGEAGGHSYSLEVASSTQGSKSYIRTSEKMQ